MPATAATKIGMTLQPGITTVCPRVRQSMTTPEVVGRGVGGPRSVVINVRASRL